MKKGDKVVIIGLVFLVGLFFIYQFITTQRNNNSDYKYVEIKVDGEVYERISLLDIKEETVVHVETKYGVNEIKIDETGAVMEYATCPDQICVESGKINYSGPVIACLPNHLSVEIVSSQEEGIDGISN